MSIKLAGHRVHPMLVSLPIGMLAMSVIFDLVFLATGAPRWADISFWSMGAGILAGLVAAPWGSIDWLGIPSGTRAKRVGLLHGVCAVVAIGLFATSWSMRYSSPTSPETIAIFISLVAMFILAFAGWLGGELVERMGIGVDLGAHADSSSSLSGHPAYEDESDIKKTAA